MNPKRKKRHEEGFLTIGEIAKEFNILSSQVRYYTQLGLLKEATRTPGKYRLYKGQETIERLKEILRLKKEGLSLEEIKEKIDREEGLVQSSGRTDPKLQGAKDVLRDYPVRFAYLFGSYAKQDTGPLSDIDIAVYLDDSLDEYKRFDLRLELISRMSGIFKTDKIDLVILNDIDLALAYRVVKDGKIIYCKDELEQIRFEAKTMSLYFDNQYYYNRHAKLSIERIAKEGIL